MTSTEDFKFFAEDGIDITPNVSYRYSDQTFNNGEDSHIFSQTDLITCNAFFNSLHIHKSIEGGNYQEPIWNFAIPDLSGKDHKIIKIPHQIVFSPLKVMRAFQGVSFAGFPKIFTKKGKGFLWENFMDYAIIAFGKPAIVEEDSLDSAAESFICKICELPQRDEQEFYISTSNIGSVFARDGIQCFNVKTTTINDILTENKVLPAINAMSKKLNDTQTKLRKTWQHEGKGVRIWSFPINKLEPYGFKVNTKKKIDHDTHVITNMNEVFTFKPKVEVMDGRTGIKRGEL